jgi:membrane-bound serine protease (ClpP class)
MTLIGLFFVVGVILLGFEVFIPGGILGVIAGLSFLSGVVVAFGQYGLGGGLLALVVALVMIGAMLYFEFAILPKTPWGQRLFLKSAVTGTASPDRERDYIGSTGVTLTALGPSGYVEIDGKRLEAFSKTGFLEAGVPIQVVGTDNFRLIVTSQPE